jgi:hypothetical protein
MKTIEFYLNIVHFCYYKAHYKLHLLTNKVNPFRLIAEIPIVKRRHKKMGIINFQKKVDNIFGDKIFGLSTTVAGGFLFALLFVFFFGVFGLLRKLFTEDVLETIHFIIFGISSAILCYIFVFKKDKYIKYFDKFEKWDKEEKRKYNWFTFAITIIVFCLWILSF